jgi:hypothetical protein
MSCDCANCGNSDDVLYMYREKNGKTVFTGFVQNKSGDRFVWIGKDENEMFLLDMKNQSHIDFFMKEMKQYD